MKKTLLVLLLAVIAALCCALCLTACDIVPGGNNITGGSGQGDVKPDDKSEHEHKFSEWIEEVPATCIKPGIAGHYECYDCHKYFDRELREITKPEIVDFDAHLLGEWIEGTPSTCTETGIMGHFKCEYCNSCFDIDHNQLFTIDLDIDPDAHLWDDGVETTAPTCNKEGVKTYTCHYNKDHTRTENIDIDPNAHLLVDWTEGTPATCMKKGTLEHFTCEYCNQYFDGDGQPLNSIDIDIDENAHLWDNGVETTAPTCVKEGVKTYTCQYNKDHTRTENIDIDENAHKFGDLVAKTDPTCMKKGIKEHYQCEYCQKYFDGDGQPLNSIDIDIDENAHLWDNGVETTAPTCVKEGVMTYTCQYNKDHTRTEDIDIDENAHLLGELTKGTPATCMEKGIKEHYQCEYCQKYFDGDKQPLDSIDIDIDENAHNFGNLVGQVDPTCSQKGVKEHYRCEYCQKYFDADRSEKTFAELEIDINPDAHLWDDGRVTIPVTCSAEGETIYTCRHNDAHTRTEVIEIDPDAHDFGSGDKCSICNVASNYTKGLQFVLNEGGQSYTLNGRGEAADSDIVIPCAYMGKPVTAVAAVAFNQDKLKSITIPDSITYIGGGALYDCTELESITVPFIGDGTNETFPLSHLFVGGSYPYNSRTPASLKTVTITNGTMIGNGSFRDCKNIETITLNEGIASIGQYAFNGCSSLKSVNIPDSVAAIGSYAFGGTAAEIKWGDSPTFTTIENNAFSGYKGARITIPASVTYIGDLAFAYCVNLESIEVDGQNNNYLSQNGVLFSKDKRNLIKVPQTKNSVTIPESVTTICSYAFENCKNLESITIPDNVISIKDLAFDGCTGLTGVYINDMAAWCNIEFGADYSNSGGYVYNFNSNPLYYAHNLYLNSNPINDLNIPQEVTEIKNFSFIGFYGTSITLPVNITSIGNYAFSECINIKNINLPESVISIGDHAFYGCVHIERITIPNGVKSISNYAFENCTAIESVTIPNSVTSIGYNAFNGCNNITNATMPALAISYIPKDNLQTAVITGGDFVESNAFGFCTSLTSVTIGAISVKDYAFRSCTGLENVTIGINVAAIDNDAFNGCIGLKNVYISDIRTWCSIEFGNDSSNPLYYAQNLYLNNKPLNNIQIPQGVTQIPIYAFKGCASLTSIALPDSVTSIGSGAFKGCSNLETIVIPDSVASIGSGAFDGCNNITKATMPCLVISYIPKEKLQKVVLTSGDIDNWAFHNCKNLTSVSIGAKSIAVEAFHGCTSLENVTLFDGVISIGDKAFYGCTNITSIEIPNSVISIGDKAFFDCKKLTSIHIGKGVSSIGDRAFTNCTSLAGVYITDIAAWCNIEFIDITLTYWSNPLFYAHKLYVNNDLVTELDIPQGVAEIKDQAFYNCTSLTSIALPDGVTSIGYRAFYGCENITNVTIPDSVTFVSYNAFSGCTNITNATMPALVTGCIPARSFQTVVITSGDTIDSSSFSNSNLESITIPASVTTIYVNAFYQCQKLKNVYITDIGAWCNIEFYNDDANPLYYADNLYLNNELVKNIEIPQEVTSIPVYAFSCTSLESITVPESVTSIGNNAFTNCSNLKSINIPSSVISIGRYVFYNCSSLTDVTFENTTGWKVSTNSDMSEATAVELTSPIQNTVYLKSTYCNYFWKRFVD